MPEFGVKDWLIAHRFFLSKGQYDDVLELVEEAEVLQKRKNDLLLKIGGLIRGDWSGNYFDGRDVLKWIIRVVDGDRLDELEAELKTLEEAYY